MINDQQASNLNAADILNLKAPTLADAARSLYATLPHHVLTRVRKPNPMQEASRKNIAAHIGKHSIPWADVEAVAADCQAKGKFKDVPADVVTAELTKIRALARRANEHYDTEA
jgi:hypothetical protein